MHLVQACPLQCIKRIWTRLTSLLLNLHHDIGGMSSWTLPLHTELLDYHPQIWPGIADSLIQCQFSSHGYLTLEPRNTHKNPPTHSRKRSTDHVQEHASSLSPAAAVTRKLARPRILETCPHTRQKQYLSRGGGIRAPLDDPNPQPATITIDNCTQSRQLPSTKHTWSWEIVPLSCAHPNHDGRRHGFRLEPAHRCPASFSPTVHRRHRAGN